MTIKKWVTINDAAVLRKALASGETRIWYCRKDATRDLSMGLDFLANRRPETLKRLRDEGPRATHVLLGDVSSTSPEEIYEALQGESWSPEGQARDLIQSLGLSHTSMSMGDIVQIGSVLFFCDDVGFKKL